MSGGYGYGIGVAGAVLPLRSKPGIVMRYQRGPLHPVNNAIDHFAVDSGSVGMEQLEFDPNLTMSSSSTDDLGASGSSKSTFRRSLMLSWTPDGIDMLYIKFSNGLQWVNYWTSNLVPLEKIEGDRRMGEHRDAHYACGWIVYSQLNYHLRCECENRLVVVGTEQERESVSKALSERTRVLEGDSEFLVMESLSLRGSIKHSKLTTSTSSVQCASQSPSSLPKESEVLGIGDGDSSDAYVSYAGSSSSSALRETGDVSVFGSGVSFVENTSSLDERSSVVLQDRLDTPVAGPALDSSSDIDVEHGWVRLGNVMGAGGQSAPFKDAHDMALKRIALQEFMDEPPSTNICDACGEIVPMDELRKHQLETCVKLYRRCTLGCGMKILLPEFPHHLENECPKRDVNCALCGDTIWADEVQTHTKNECIERPQACARGCGAVGLTYRSEQEHAITDCLHRIIVCACGLEMLSKEHVEHYMADCPKRANLCPQGCGERVPRDEVGKLSLYTP